MPLHSPQETFDTEILVVGAGPTGLTLATALTARGVRTTLVDRQAKDADTLRAAVIPFTLMISQADIERVLLARLQALGARVLRPRTLVSLAQDASSATAMLDDGSRWRARYVVGADGIHSALREGAGIAFVGDQYDESFSLADVRLTGDVPPEEVILSFSAAGMVVMVPLPGGVHRIVATVGCAPEHPSVAFVQSLLDARGPERGPVQVREVLCGSRFRLHRRLADRYRAGRVLLAGDAAHVRSPAGGQGMNAGILDAMHLADSLVNALARDANAPDTQGHTHRPARHWRIASRAWPPSRPRSVAWAIG